MTIKDFCKISSEVELYIGNNSDRSDRTMFLTEEMMRNPKIANKLVQSITATDYSEVTIWINITQANYKKLVEQYYFE